MRIDVLCQSSSVAGRLPTTSSPTNVSHETHGDLRRASTTAKVGARQSHVRTG
jgi:hypothetical protein